MSRQLPDPGTYNAKRHSPIVIQPVEQGVFAWIKYMLIGASISFVDEHLLVLVKKNGEPMQRNIDAAMGAFGWDGTNFGALQDIPIPDGDTPEFELQDCFLDDSYTPEGAEEPIIKFKAQWFNVLGGGGGTHVPLDEEGKKALHAKWSSKLKALNGKKQTPTAPTTQPAKTATPMKAPAKSQAAAPPGRKSTGAVARTSTQEEVWTAICNANPDAAKPGKVQDEWSTKFYDAQDEVKPDANGELNPQEWGQVAEKLGY